MNSEPRGTDPQGEACTHIFARAGGLIFLELAGSVAFPETDMLLVLEGIIKI